MAVSLRTQILSAAIACAGLLALGVASAASAQATPAAPVTSAAPAAVKLPNPCKTFTAKAADALFAVKRGSHLGEKSTTVEGTKQCTVTHGSVKLTIGVATAAGGFGGPLKCYSRPKLGKDGTVCVSTVKSFKVSLAIFHRYGVFFSDDYNRTLPKEGARLYALALVQYKGVKRS
jgi:hypothetical protein